MRRRQLSETEAVGPEWQLLQTIKDKVYDRVIEPAAQAAGEAGVAKPEVEAIHPYLTCPKYEAEEKEGCPQIPAEIVSQLAYPAPVVDADA